MNQRRSRRQHTVPQLHLRHFSDELGMLWAHDAQDDAIRRISPRDAAVESNFYSVIDKDGKYNDMLDKWLTSVENAAAPHYPKLLRGEVLEGQDKADFSVFLSSLYVRGPAMIRAGAEVKGMVVQQMTDVMFSSRERFDRWMDERDAENGNETSREERDEVFEFANDKSRYILQVDQKAGLHIMAAADKLTDAFFRMGWVVHNCERQHLITGDTSVTLLTPPEDFHPIYGAGGFANRRAYVTFPLSPSKLLSMAWIDQPPAGLYDVDKQEGRLFNRQRAHFAERFLFASQRDSGIQALARKHKEPGLRFESSARRTMPEIKIKRKLK